jgi:hypothetical protein
MSAVHKRMHYAMRCEFKLLSRVMYESLPDEYPYAVEGRDAAIKALDFDERVDVIPVSNPNVFSQAQRIALAQTKLQLAQAAPEMHNMHEVLSDMYQALGVRDSDRILKRLPEEEIVPKDPAQENIDSLDGVTLQAFEGQDHMSHMMAHLIFAASGIVQQIPSLAMTLQKHVMEHVQISAQEQAMQAISQQQVAPDQQQLVLDALTAQFVAQGLQQLKELNKQIMGQGPDPVVQLKQQELQLDAQAQEKDAQLDLAKLQLEQQKIAQRQAQFEDRLASQERQTAARIQAGMERELLKQRGK